MKKPRRKNGITAVLLFSLVGGMVGLAFASVPLYKLFCQVTGFAGTTQTAAATPTVASDKFITIRFDANTIPALPWKFAPAQKEIRVRAGNPAVAYYLAENLSAQSITGTSTYNVTPYKAAEYFAKTECFCFTEQKLAPGETAKLGVEFFVDPEIFNNPNTRDVKTITLSYTFFRAPGDEEGAQPKGQELTSRRQGSYRESEGS
ncbi:MAG: cytochrome c oxidase assembly protein [Proteobacteria bacterium]|nr:cytochrome c oxidase assembly protein [Pseudomonadota bacterium]MDA1022773.1 cytochrome c oxidase assembly protein [Pseudomonadota bacterium]